MLMWLLVKMFRALFKTPCASERVNSRLTLSAISQFFWLTLWMRSGFELTDYCPPMDEANGLVSDFLRSFVVFMKLIIIRELIS